MVFGNTGDESGTGVAFTRDPATGENVFYGEYLVNAQGEDVVAGVRTPRPVRELSKPSRSVYEQLQAVARRSSTAYATCRTSSSRSSTAGCSCCRRATASAPAWRRFASPSSSCEAGMITPQEALMRVEPEQLNQLLRPIFSRQGRDAAVREGRVLAKGLAAGPGAATGVVAFNAGDAEAWKAEGKQVLLVRIETSPDDIRGMAVSEGVLTARGGMTSHAALVARQMGKVCVVGCEELDIDYKERVIRVDDRVVNEGDWLSIDGFTGEVILGQLETRPSEVLQVLLEGSMKGEDSLTFRFYDELMQWADAERRLLVRTNADQPDQSADAIAFGAQGIGLCRTEHMFFGGERITAVREMILANDTEGRERALAKLLPMQRDDFSGIFRVMGERPVTIRLLDPPLHEFMPHTDAEQRRWPRRWASHRRRLPPKWRSCTSSTRCSGTAAAVSASPTRRSRRCRHGRSSRPPASSRRRASTVLPEIMIPLVGTKKELENQAAVVRATAAAVFAEQGASVDYLVGTMIEIPRAALTADKIADEAEFFSFGTNDLTQMTFGVSRDDAGKFMPLYVSEERTSGRPIRSRRSTSRASANSWRSASNAAGRRAQTSRSASAASTAATQRASSSAIGMGMNYVSCSPFRIPVARLAAAQAAIEERSNIRLEK